jgi:hypothetical protein
LETQRNTCQLLEYVKERLLIYGGKKLRILNFLFKKVWLSTKTKGKKEFVAHENGRGISKQFIYKNWIGFKIQQ